MKNQILITILLLVSFCAYSQVHEMNEINRNNLIKNAISEDYRLDSLISISRSIPGEWEKSYKTIYSTEQSGDTNILKEYYFQYEDGKYLPHNGSWDYVIDDVKIVLHKGLWWDSIANDWYLDSYSIRQFNTNNDITEIAYYSYDSVSLQWQIIQKFNAVYDEDFNWIEYTKNYFEDSSWVTRYKEIHAYDDNKILIYNKTFRTSLSGSTLNPWMTYLYEYDNDKLMTGLIYHHHSATGDSTLEKIDSITWNGDYERFIVKYKLNGSTYEVYKKEYVYADDTLYKWNYQIYYDSVWKLPHYQEAHFLPSGSLYYFFTYDKDVYTDDSTAHEDYYWYKNDGITIDSNSSASFLPPYIPVMTDHHRNYYYYTDVTDIPEYDHTLNNVRAYPNPASDICRIEFVPDIQTSISVFDISGRLLNEHMIYQQDHLYLDIRQFQTGILIIHVSNSKSNSSIKLLKQ